MVDVARVNLFSQRMGTFRWDDRYQTVQFEYDRDFVGRGWEPSPLMMPVREGRIYSFAGLNRETYMGLPGMLADPTATRRVSMRLQVKMIICLCLRNILRGNRLRTT